MSDLIAALQDARRLCANIDEFGVDRAELDRVWGRINTVLASADRSPQGQDAEERLDAKHESAVPKADAQRTPTSPPIGTDQELIERLRTEAVDWPDDGAAGPLMREAADALQSRISEVERLTARVTKLEETLRQVASRSHAALSQQGKV